ncbi:hypothetical protein D3C72_2088390 [compost metagenome]
MALCIGHRRFALVQHPYIAAQRKCAQHKLCGRTLGSPSEQRLAKTHREPQYLDTTGYGYPIVPVLMHGNQKAKGHDECNKGQQHG